MLKVENLRQYFGGVKAVDGVSFAVNPGQCVALIGPNGAGKSTCFACLAGQYAEYDGSLSWRGQALAGLEPAARLALGIGRTFQVAELFSALSVLQNVQLAAQASNTRKNFSAFKTLASCAPDASMALLAATGLQALAKQDVLSLPYGAKKRLELAVALAANPSLLLLDEPAAGLAGPERASMMQLIKSLTQDGMAVLYTEHNMDAVIGIADHVLVLIEGRLVTQGSFEEVARDPVVRSRYLGTQVKQRA
ncbi:Lipopolysaccharide export system ATP-binding protein LptB [Polaromonas vacuolata]|uniref:Lipopolysaccharide export system ATP-binding protein LptB n=1 Tax=Polaromonas vacuolata TaxID=37448 RepID=A0A6H2H8G5_9BURK|nr:ABC transporter ATP-binding protein [Polaromonas vacuolata]QJC56083.1 Lipopolysaccharide export system ATP-binding protein LptB [Polaromonas vacuolata]